MAQALMVSRDDDDCYKQILMKIICSGKIYSGLEIKLIDVTVAETESRTLAIAFTLVLP